MQGSLLRQPYKTMAQHVLCGQMSVTHSYSVTMKSQTQAATQTALNESAVAAVSAHLTDVELAELQGVLSGLPTNDQRSRLYARLVQHREALADLEASAKAIPEAPKESLIITFQQAMNLVTFFGGHDAEVTVQRGLPGHPEGLYAWCTEYPEEGSQYLGPTEVDDELSGKGMTAPSLSEMALRDLLEEVRQNFTRDDDLPGDLLPRIDAALDTEQPTAARR